MSEIPLFKICLPTEEMHTRGPSILRIIKPLLDDPSRFFVVPKSPDKETFAWAVTRTGASQNGSYTDWRFRTRVDGVFANYFERWLRFYNGIEELWYLDRAYLHFYLRDTESRDTTEYLLLHCDPNEIGEHAIYKQSPHLHIKKAPAPWPGAHIALNIGYMKPMLRDAASLTETLELAVVMLKNQILDELII